MSERSSLLTGNRPTHGSSYGASSSRRNSLGPRRTLGAFGDGTHDENYDADNGYLRNTGNVARDHLANERTALSYIRTGVALVSAGAAFVKFFNRIVRRLELDDQWPHPVRRLTIHYFAQFIGVILVLLGAILLCIGPSRYFSVQKILQTGNFNPSQRHVYAINASFAAMLVAVTAVIFAFPR